MTEALGARRASVGWRVLAIGPVTTRARSSPGVGKLELRVPQDGAGRFSTDLFKRYQRSVRPP
jgi:putative transposase